MNNREELEQLLAENEDDVESRLIYADLLEEAGEHEEAERHRTWNAAKELIVKWCAQVTADQIKQSSEYSKEWGYEDSEYDPLEYDTLTYEMLIDIFDRGSWGNRESHMYQLLEDDRHMIKPLKRAWRIVTGKPYGEEYEENDEYEGFRCAC